MRVMVAVAALAVLVGLTGCSTSVVDTGLEPSRRMVRDDFVLGFASGLLMVENVRPTRMCRGQVARVVTGVSAGNLLVQTLTAGIVSPRTVTVTCARGSGEDFILIRNEREGRRFRMEREFQMRRMRGELEREAEQRRHRGR